MLQIEETRTSDAQDIYYIIVLKRESQKLAPSSNKSSYTGGDWAGAGLYEPGHIISGYIKLTYTNYRVILGGSRPGFSCKKYVSKKFNDDFFTSER